MSLTRDRRYGESGLRNCGWGMWTRRFSIGLFAVQLSALTGLIVHAWGYHPQSPYEWAMLCTATAAGLSPWPWLMRGVVLRLQRAWEPELPFPVSVVLGLLSLLVGMIPTWYVAWCTSQMLKGT